MTIRAISPFSRHPCVSLVRLGFLCLSLDLFLSELKVVLLLVFQYVCDHGCPLRVALWLSAVTVNLIGMRLP